MESYSLSIHFVFCSSTWVVKPYKITNGSSNFPMKQVPAGKSPAQVAAGWDGFISLWIRPLKRHTTYSSRSARNVHLKITLPQPPNHPKKKEKQTQIHKATHSGKTDISWLGKSQPFWWYITKDFPLVFATKKCPSTQNTRPLPSHRYPHEAVRRARHRPWRSVAEDGYGYEAKWLEGQRRKL